MIEAVGDSHTGMFRYVPQVSCVLQIPGATAYGLLNEDSRTSAGQRILETINNSTSKWFIFQLGEVDCNALAWRHGLGPDGLIREATLNYGAFLRRCLNKWRDRRWFVSAVPPPIVRSYQDDDYLARPSSPRSKIKASRRERLQLSKRFNRGMQTICDDLDVGFIDYWPHIMNGCSIGSVFIRSHSDPHLHPRSMASVLGRLLTKFGVSKCT